MNAAHFGFDGFIHSQRLIGLTLVPDVDAPPFCVDR